jgi:hypothetical protein
MLKPLPILSTFPSVSNIMADATCAPCNFPLASTGKDKSTSSIVTVHPCLHKFHLTCFTSNAPGWPPYKCPECGGPAREILKEDGTPWRVQVVFPPGTTEEEVREYLKMVGLEKQEEVEVVIAEFEEERDARK